MIDKAMEACKILVQLIEEAAWECPFCGLTVGHAEFCLFKPVEEAAREAIDGNQMVFNKYQKLAEMTAGAWVDGLTSRLACAALGLAGEAGEVANKVKKQECHEHPDMEECITEELGDCLWYIAELCTALGVDMNRVAIDNILKLSNRYPEGYDSEASVGRGQA